MPISAPVRNSKADPRLQGDGVRLVARFCYKRRGSMVLDSPRTALPDAPKNDVDLVALVRIEDLEQFSAIGPDLQVVMICSANLRRPIVRFQNRIPLIDIADAKTPQAGGISFRSKDTRVRAIEEVNIELPHSIHLIDTACRP